MRLTQHQAQTIKTQAKQVFGPGTKVYLFGSRVDNHLKGGDIDLYVVPPDKADHLEQSLRLHAALQIHLGEQSIDIVVATDSNRLIEQEALRTGVQL